MHAMHMRAPSVTYFLPEPQGQGSLGFVFFTFFSVAPADEPVPFIAYTARVPRASVKNIHV